MIQAEGVDAHFHCNIHISALNIKWRINEVSLSQSHLPNVTSQSSGSNSTLTLPALAMHNGTALQCGAYIYDNDNGRFRTEWSTSSLLRVQGNYDYTYPTMIFQTKFV